ncbi:hypothetical protein ASPWEDRAFT_31136 [Aspergillus wentii DTO 134E9]|uniref:Acyltransferase 3 domain-containing protein n=1 Tax=Aspergillus wentii DTO 134E9 TaxID=1073089 RepID=A0A1L9RBF3_ASPWE|nr:uncharacterized protein ASPWEDRAFT_31136 [Aspergillus wentii DTO 134E9]KAI9934775.1 hypothetical protein MW887_000392 [Aspergillus wentii]OJJ32203.1 hypothetical protein ASPWEDRAFT_31136 [Aspergillus wentii DTO 134E9]
MERTQWLDGLRGIAAAIVAFDHYFMGEITLPFRSFGAEPAEENRRLIQLPPIRLLFAARAMVPLFFVISGYALTRRRDTPQFFRRLSSSVTRRAFRIYLPVLVIATISQFLYFFGMYHWEFQNALMQGVEPWTSPWSHLQYLTRYMMDNMNIIDLKNNTGLNGQLWTMPMEVRGSCVIYLATLGMSGWRSALRPWALAITMLYFLCYGLWDIFCFVAGMYLAEIRTGAADEDENKLPLYVEVNLPNIGKVPLARIGKYITFAVGIYIMCLGDDGYLPLGYQSLNLIQPSYWRDWGTISASWAAIGSLMVVFAISGLKVLQRPLNSRPIQYLGRISFSLYLVHQSIFHLWRDPVKNFIWLVLHKDLYPGSEGAIQSPWTFYTTWISSGVLMGAITIYAAHYYTRFVDEKCLSFTKKIERFLTAGE